VLPPRTEVQGGNPLLGELDEGPDEPESPSVLLLDDAKGAVIPPLSDLSEHVVLVRVVPATDDVERLLCAVNDISTRIDVETVDGLVDVALDDPPGGERLDLFGGVPEKDDLRVPHGDGCLVFCLVFHDIGPSKTLEQRSFLYS